MLETYELMVSTALLLRRAVVLGVLQSATEAEGPYVADLRRTEATGLDQSDAAVCSGRLT